MSRKWKKIKPLIYVCCEGESEEAYIDFLAKTFADTVVVKNVSGIKSSMLFEDADKKFRRDKKYRDNLQETDEIWFFFDVEQEDKGKWDKRLKIINYLRKRKKTPGIKVRLLMTSGCIEYWFMLHYEKYRPPVLTVADKHNILNDLKNKVPDYKKGDPEVIAKIAAFYKKAEMNAKELLQQLLKENDMELDDTDFRNQWLYSHEYTFSTVFEGIQFLEELA